jgi:hypothetical protein
MTYKIIEIPGGSTTLDDGPNIKIVGASNEPVSVIVTYIAGGSVEGRVFGEITFDNVLEYRWIAGFVDYDDYPQHKQDYELGLIEVLNSAYVENMASKGPLRELSNQRFGAATKEKDVRHFRLGFDDYGCFDVIALAVSVRTV